VFIGPSGFYGIWHQNLLVPNWKQVNVLVSEYYLKYVTFQIWHSRNKFRNVHLSVAEQNVIINFVLSINSCHHRSCYENPWKCLGKDALALDKRTSTGNPNIMSGGTTSIWAAEWYCVYQSSYVYIH